MQRERERSINKMRFNETGYSQRVISVSNKKISTWAFATATYVCSYIHAFALNNTYRVEWGKKKLTSRGVCVSMLIYTIRAHYKKKKLAFILLHSTIILKMFIFSLAIAGILSSSINFCLESFFFSLIRNHTIFGSVARTEINIHES